jgi:hypothetical protein
MYGELTLNQQLNLNNSAEAARQTAVHHFRRAQTQSRLATLWAKLTGRPNHLLTLTATTPTTAGHYTGIHTIPLTQIKGSEGRSHDFDAAFRPVKQHNRSRWIAIAAARLNGTTLPPVTLLQVGDHYYVRDGNHRISVARALGETAIEAEVTIWQ